MFREISPMALQENAHALIGQEWMLVTAGSRESHNTMTASWGGLGYLWQRPVATIYIRPQRYTREFVEREARFTLSFFGAGKQRAALALLGTKSGREGDKIAEAGLTPVQLAGAPAFEEARLVLVCKKLYRQDMLEECFLDHDVADTHYPEKDFHRIYVGEVEKAFVQ